MLGDGSKSTDPTNSKMFKVKKSVGDDEDEEQKTL